MKPYGLHGRGAWFGRHDDDNDEWYARARERSISRREIAQGVETLPDLAEDHMDDYEFTLILDVKEITEELENKLYEADCLDASLFQYGNTIGLSFFRQADSLNDAIVSAKQDVRSAGIKVLRVETCG